jgi:hypothetical protein
VTKIAGFEGATEITHIFFLDGTSNYTTISSGAFRASLGVDTKLQAVYLPNTITRID